MKHLLPLSLLILLVLSCEKKTQAPPNFSFHLFMEPQHLDPALSRASSASYFFFNTLRGLYKIAADNKPVEEGGRCTWTTERKLECELKDFKWSNGDAITAQDYLRSFHHLVDPKTASPRAHLLKFIQNYREIMIGLKSPSSLGIKAPDSRHLVFNFLKPDKEFIYKLASSATYPTHKNHSYDKDDFNQFVVNGPYQIKAWISGKEMTLEPNPHYALGHRQRPLLKIYFIDDEMTAFRLYESKKLSFLRRIPSQLIDQLKTRSDFFQQPMLRFDYYGFGAKLRKSKKLRQALVHAVDYNQLATLLGALERPGCPSLPKDWFLKQKCYDFNSERAKKQMDEISPKLKSSVYQLKVSQLGGNDIKKQAEFIQNQWKKHLGLNIQVQQVEQKVFLNELRQSPPDIFRKGVGLDLPTCLNALETFGQDSKQNFLKFKNKNYLSLLAKMRQLKVQSSAYKKLCQQAMDLLMDDYSLIPLGEMHFTMMAAPEFTGWTMNGLNQLDLSQVHRQ